MGKRRRILTIYKGHENGGDCRRLYRLIDGLIKADYEVHYVAASPLIIPNSEQLVFHQMRLPLKYLSPSFFWIAFGLLAPVYLLQLVLTRRFKAIVCFTTTYSFLAAIPSLLSFTPSYLILRSVPWKRYGYEKLSWVFRTLSFIRDIFSLLSVRKVIAASYSIRDGLIEKLPIITRNIAVVPFAVDSVLGEDGENPLFEKDKKLNKAKKEARLSFGVPDKSLVLVTSGVLHAGKNVEMLLRAMSSSENEELFLIISGDGPDKSRIESLVHGLGLTERVLFTGWLSDFSEVVLCSDIFIHASKDMVLSNSIFEALSAGIPVLGADTLPIREILKYEELLFDSDHIEKLATKFELLAKGKGLFEQITELSKMRARELSFDWGGEIIDLIENRG